MITQQNEIKGGLQKEQSEAQNSMIVQLSNQPKTPLQLNHRGKD